MDDQPDVQEDVFLQLHYFAKLNYAMQQHGIGIIQKLVLGNRSAKQHLDVTISTIPALAPSIHRHIDSVEAESLIELEKIMLDWDALKLADLTETQLVSLVINVSQGDDSLYQFKEPIELLPADTWAGACILPELLCSFVTPNAPEIPLILHRAAALLADWTGDASFTGYASRSEDRVRRQMAAIYQAIAELGIVYSLPPADFECHGQRIRMCDKMMAQRLGTCLDMAVFYATCMEAIGLNPILVLIKGHAFVGGWLIEDMLNDPVNDDVTIIRKRIAVGINEMSFVEATTMNAGKSMSFEESCRIAKDHFDNEALFEYAIDVKRCRLGGVRPLFSRQQKIEVGSHFEGHAVDSTPDALAPRSVMDEAPAQIVSKQKVWERKLLDLSLRNNLLNVRQTRSLIPLMSAKLHLLEDALADGKDFVLMPRPSDWRPAEVADSGFKALTEGEAINELISHELSLGRLHCFESETEAHRAFTHLYRSARLSMEENGANTLYLALGLLRWYESPVSERARFAPILLLPVEMKHRRGVSGGYAIRSSEEEIMVNITLLEMLKQDFSIDLSVINQLPRDEYGVDITLIFNTLRNLLKNQARWDIEEQALLGTFSFSKFIMWNDIHNNADLLRRNPLVDSLITSQIKWDVPEAVDLDLDHELRPSELLLPVPADSYQMEAVHRAAVVGESFVLHGPPGSGKSQTITNIIANALYRGKRVLFVAEKMAALSVVHKRLSQIGLESFCLELHSNKSTKTAVLSQLEVSAQYQLGQAAVDFEGESNRLYQLRHELREHVDALHTQLPMGLSLYETLYALEQLPPEPSVPYCPVQGRSARMTAREWSDELDCCARLQSIAKICGSPANHPLKSVGARDYSPMLKERAQNALKELLDAYTKLSESLVGVNPVFDLPADSLVSLNQMQQLADCLGILLGDAALSSALLDVDDVEELGRKADELCRRGEEYDRLMASITHQFKPSVMDLDAALLLAQWQEAETTWFLPYFFTCWGITRRLRAELLPQAQLSSGDVPLLLQGIIDAQREQKFLASQQSWMEDHVPNLQQDWSAIRRAISAVQEINASLLKMLGDMAQVKRARRALSEHFFMGKSAFYQLYAEPTASFLEALECCQAQEKCLQEILLIPDYEGSLSQRHEAVQLMMVNLGQLRDWCNWKSCAAKVAEDYPHFADFIHYAETVVFEPQYLQKEYERGIYKDLCQHQMSKHPRLTQFNGLIFEERLGKYRELVALNQELARLELCAKLGANIPNFAREAAQNSELGILQRSIRSRGRGMTIRQLFDKLPELMPRLKPCMLMSPMSVAQYLDAGREPFDLVIFDEASQMPTCEAVGTIARGKNIVVVGDPRQMPPTSFFASNSVDEEHLDLEDLESILEDCLGLSMPSRHLRWHYRSKHESLIAFSNCQYYENKLLTFPSPDDLCSKLSFIPVKGYYDKGKSRCNKAEAEAVVAAALHHLADPIKCKRSLGIISFSQVQQSLIEDLLMHELSKPSNAALEAIALGGDEPVFVKNLENVQGDERDVIFFSVGYGPDSEGRVSHNFGPLNREGGERRLNVAVSRARYEMQVFSTLSPDQIDLSRSKAQGVAGLRAFLDFAQKGKVALLQKSGSVYTPQASIIEIIADELSSMGYQVKRHVGSSSYRVDLAIVHPERPDDYLAAIISDGASYQSAPTLRDREITRVGVLRMLGWNVLRIWTLDWWMDRSQVMKQLVADLEALKTCRQEVEEIIIDIKPELTAASGIAGRKYDYQRCELPAVNYGEQDPLQAHFAPQMMGQIHSIINIEAPVQCEYLIRRIMDLWGIKMLTKRVQAHFELLFDTMHLHRTGSGAQLTLWASAEQASSFGIYRVGGDRDAKYIPREELCLAAYEMLQQQMAMPREDLQSQVIDLFELGRKTKALRNVVDVGIAAALELGYIIEEGGRCKLP